MRTIDRVRARSSRRGLPRVGALLMLGALILMLYSFSRDQRIWTGFLPKAPEKPVAQKSAKELDKKYSANARAAGAKPSEVAAIADAPAGTTETGTAAADKASNDKPAAETPATAQTPSSESPATLAATTPAASTPDSSPPTAPSTEIDPPKDPAPADGTATGTEPASPATPTPIRAGAPPEPADDESGSQFAPVDQPAAPTDQETPPESFIPGTDQDSEEWDEAVVEFQAITDQTEEVSREEMSAYWRMFTWCNKQTVDQMLARVHTDIKIDDMLKRSSQNRGKIVRLDLHVRRIRSYEAPKNPAGVEHVYELWGTTKSTGAWLLVGLVSEIPPGFPSEAASIDEDVVFVGYYFKQIGYLSGLQQDGDRLKRAPMLIGKLAKRAPAAVAAAPEPIPIWVWGLAGVAGVFVVGLCVWPWLRPRSGPPPYATIGAPKLSNMDDWTVGEEKEPGFGNPDQADAGDTPAKNEGNANLDGGISGEAPPSDPTAEGARTARTAENLLIVARGEDGQPTRLAGGNDPYDHSDRSRPKLNGQGGYVSSN